ncbi:MAG: hypothetical protein RI580_02570 [Halothece sp. Uz-M2-17]|nr:hypothetical protein [Halothece sp. Uz-M2-17]
MKRPLAIVVAGLLTACNPFTQKNQSQGNIENCPSSPESPVSLISPEEQDLPNPFDFFTETIKGNQDFIRFQGEYYDFVYCRGNAKWTVQPGTYQPQEEAVVGEEFYERLANPPYETVEFQGKTYQYRTRLEPNPFQDNETYQEAERVLFEILPPERDKPIIQELYTREDVKKANLGFSLAYPESLNVIQWRDRLLWSITAPQGEGFTGLATLFVYDPETEDIEIIQPEGIEGQMITDIAVTEKNRDLLWLTTQTSGEGNPHLPGLGLVRYNAETKKVTAYHIRNSPMVGAIPSELFIEGENLWLGTGNGICQVQWQSIDQRESWSCWRYAVLAESPEEIALYPTSSAEAAATTLEPTEPLEILWQSPLFSSEQRYEIRYEEGFEITVQEGKDDWSQGDWEVPPYFAPIYWPGQQWHWNGTRFQRGFDEVAFNFVGGGPSGIGTTYSYAEGYPANTHHALRGDLELLQLTDQKTKVRHYSGWVNAKNLSPYVTIFPVKLPENPQPNPLLKHSG